MEVEYLTKEKHDDLIRELDHLKTVKRAEVADQLKYSKTLGDLSENAEYHEARDLQAQVEDRIMKLEAVLKSAKIVSSHSKDIVGVGSVVTVQKEGSKDKKEYILVGMEEADISQSKISVNSPFGQAVLGKKKGDNFSFNAPSGTTTYKIVDIQ